MKHLYFYYAKFTFWDAEKNFRTGRIDGTLTCDRRIDSADEYQRFRDRTKAVIETDHGTPIGNMVIKSFSYLGEAR